MKKYFFIATALLTLPLAYAEEYWALSSAQSNLSISGDSSVHAWESRVDSFSVKAHFHSADGRLLGVDSLLFTADVRSISSGKKLMDTKTRDALNADDHPRILFQTNGQASHVYEDTIQLSGRMSLAGVSKDIRIIGIYQMFADSTLSVKGQVDIDMTDYAVKPPTAMMGMLKTDPQVQIRYHMHFVASPTEEKTLQ